MSPFEFKKRSCRPVEWVNGPYVEKTQWQLAVHTNEGLRTACLENCQSCHPHSTKMFPCIHSCRRSMFDLVSLLAGNSMVCLIF